MIRTRPSSLTSLPTATPVLVRAPVRRGDGGGAPLDPRAQHASLDATAPRAARGRIQWLRCIPFLGLHAACALALWTGVSPVALGVCLALYVLRMFFVTAFYHRYFSHRSFKTSRGFQLIMALCGATAAQRGPLWWAAQHRHHHASSDGEEDRHSPRVHGLLWSHMGWFLTREAYGTPAGKVKDWSGFPELRWLERLEWAPPVLLCAALHGLGVALEDAWPALGTSGLQMSVWGFAISTVLLYHATYTINSLAHRVGSRRFATRDDSRNNWLLALLTLGEGWHNNHHHYPASARQGFYWWELDLTYYALLLLKKLGLIWDVRPVPARALARRRVAPSAGGARRADGA